MLEDQELLPILGVVNDDRGCNHNDEKGSSIVKETDQKEAIELDPMLEDQELLRPILLGVVNDDRGCNHNDEKGGSIVKETDQKDAIGGYHSTSTVHAQASVGCSIRTAQQQDCDCAHEDHDGDGLGFDDGDHESDDELNRDDGFINAELVDPISSGCYADAAIKSEDSAANNKRAAIARDARGCSSQRYYYSQRAGAGTDHAQRRPQEHAAMASSDAPASRIFTYLSNNSMPPAAASNPHLSTDCLYGPQWLKEFIVTEYFTGSPCPVHNKSIKYFKWDFARGAGKLLCIKCKQNYRPSPSSICLQVRRASNLDSIHKQELTQYIDTSGIFTFIINGEDIHYLRSTYPVKPLKGARAYCVACTRALKEKREDEVVCSIQCKLDALWRGIMPPHLSRLDILSATSNMVDANSHADCAQTNNAPPQSGIEINREMLPDQKEGFTDMLRLLREYDIDASEKNCLLKLYLKLEGFDESSISEDWKRNLLNKLESKDAGS